MNIQNRFNNREYFYLFFFDYFCVNQKINDGTTTFVKYNILHIYG